ncbi:MAG: hypothetical protein IJ072_03335 [Oscillospiraceae bacterium]|nr:hypothetical protein [Oscillospiraceae bacterium]
MGESYEVTVSNDAEAQIPAGAALRVTEVTQESAEYESYVEQTADTVNSDISSVSYIKLLDISIVDAEGLEVTPRTPIDVQIRLLDKRESPAEDSSVQVVHFGAETEVVENTLDDDTVSFQAESFSVYAIVGVETPLSVAELDGKTYGLIWNNDNVSGTGVMAQKGTVQSTITLTDENGVILKNENGKNMTVKESISVLKGKSTLIKTDPIGRHGRVFVAQNSEISMWSFHRLEGSEFYVTAEVNGELKYVRFDDTVNMGNGQKGVSLVDEPDDRCRITISEQNGKYKFTGSGRVLSVSGSNFVTVADSDNSSNVWMYLAERSANLNDDDFVRYTAEKVSVSGTVDDNGNVEYDVKNGEQVVIYTRIWNGEKYDYYVIDHDGMLVEAYESGDVISWVEGKVDTMLWNFTEYYYEGTTTPNYYYELQNDYSGKYIAPVISGRTFLSDGKIGLNLNGRRYNHYYTTILAWDDHSYDYAALKVTDGLELTSAPLEEASDFYFAKIITQNTEDSLIPVSTVDNTQYGITVKMRNYSYQGYYAAPNKYRSLTQSSILGINSEVSGSNTYPGLLSKNLNGEYPVTTGKAKKAGGAENVSLEELFGDEAMPVNHQFLTSTYSETGYFEYNCTENFAHLITSEDDSWFGKDRPSGGTYAVGDFVVYNELGTSELSAGSSLKHGQFLPYNDLTEGKFSAKTNETDLRGAQLSSLNPRKGEKLYAIPADFNSVNGTKENKKFLPDGQADYFFGMEMSAKFMQTASGVDYWGHDLIFEFSGDDDFWFYVDGMLVLDLGGVHSAVDGSINFRTGKVVVNGRNTDLRTLYKEAYLENHPNAGQSEINDFLDGYFKDGGTVFKDFSGHSMKMFYMERGAMASNLHMRFNIAPYVDGEVQLEKDVTGSDNVNTVFPFQIWYNDEEHNGELTLFKHTDKVIDSKTREPVAYAATYEVDGVEYDSVYFLEPGQMVLISLPDEDTQYYIKECALNSKIFDPPEANKEDTTEISTSAQNRKDYRIETADVNGRKKVIFENHVRSDALRTLTITKMLWQDDARTSGVHSGTGEDADNTEFCFRIYIGKSGDGSYTVYNMGKYYMKGPDNCYLIYNSELGDFESTGIERFEDLSTELAEGQWKSQRDMATFYTSPGGAADRIKADYSIEIPELIDGTAFMVEERDDETPAGYKLLGYTLTEGGYSSENQGESTGTGTISAERENQTVSVHNEHGYGVTMEKVWSDAPFMVSHDPIYFAIYLTGSDAPYHDSVRKLEDPNTSINWFFPELEHDRNLNDYEIYEVALTGGNIVVDPDTGVVSGYESIVRKNEGNKIPIGGTTYKNVYSSNTEYTVSYSRYKLSAQELEDDVNARKDTVYNSRPGIKLVKTDVNGNLLKGAVFKLVDKNGVEKAFTSDEKGVIAVAYLEDGEDYTLKEITAPLGYGVLIRELTIRKGADGLVYVNGSPTPENQYYDFEQVAEPTANVMPTVTIQNKPLLFQAVKIDGHSEMPLAGVHFALYKEVFESTYPYKPMPDYSPMAGYEDLVTDDNGVIPKIVLVNPEHPDGLGAGTYYLRETEGPGSYKALDIDIRITVYETGQITLESAARPNQSGSWSIGDLSADVAEILNDGDVLKLIIKNVPREPVRIRKLRQASTNQYLDGVRFELYSIDQIEDGQPKENTLPLIERETENGGILNLGALQENISYYLFETQTIEHYQKLSDPVIISYLGSGRLSATLNGKHLSCGLVKDEDDSDVWEVKVYNTPLHNITVAKEDGYGTPVQGANLQILDANGGVIYEWTSSDEPELITDMATILTPYTLHEVTAPEGYAAAQDIAFILDAQGNVWIGGTLNGNKIKGGTKAEGNLITMIDPKGVQMPQSGTREALYCTAVGAAVVLLGFAPLVNSRRKKKKQCQRG